MDCAFRRATRSGGSPLRTRRFAAAWATSRAKRHPGESRGPVSRPGASWIPPSRLVRRMNRVACWAHPYGLEAASRAKPSTANPMSKKDEPVRPEARLPKGLFDTPASELRASADMLATIRGVFERYGFEPLDTPAIEYTDALGKFLPDQDRPNEGVFSFKDDDEQWLSLRYDLTAPLARYVAENYQNLPKPFRRYQVGPGVAEREAGAGPLPPIHPVRCRHGRRVVGRRRRRALHARRRHARSARRPARAICGQGQQPQSSRWGAGAIGLGGDARRRASASPCCARSTSSIGLGGEGVRALLGKGRKDESGDFTKGAGLDAQQQIDVAHANFRWSMRRYAAMRCQRGDVERSCQPIGEYRDASLQVPTLNGSRSRS